MLAVRSLALRFALVALVIGAVGAVLVVYGLKTQLRRDFESQAIASASSVTELIRQATRAGMLSNQWDEVREVIRNIDRQPDIVRIRLFDKKGVVVLSSDGKEVGQRVDVSATECRGCHVPGPPRADLPRAERVRIWRTAEGQRVLGMIEPVPGGPECSGACHQHAPEQRILGVIDTQLSLAAADAFSRQHSTQLAVAVLIVQISAAAGIALVVAWMLRRRLRPMLAALGRLGSGDYAARTPDHRHDEFAAVGAAFNKMAQDLERSHEELQRWAQTLQDRVDEKTRELRTAQDQMVRAERLASIGRLAAVVAHELNNPLAGVQVYARRVQKALAAGPLPADRQLEIGDWMATIDREVGRCGRIVQDLLSFSRRESPHRSPVAANELVHRAARLLGHKLSLEDVALELHLDERLPVVVADGAQIEQALLAVMINAVEAMPQGGVLMVATRPHVGGGIEIEVADTGVGIEPDVMPHVLEPFFTTKPEGQGTGLGLSVVYGIVSRHGGRVDITSAPGEGTHVTMVFPDVPLPGDAPADAAPGAGR